MSITLKKYNAKEALSKLITEDRGDTYKIKGPMGKGLDIQESGIHIAFAGGTGILPFLDLVALLIRLNLEVPEGTQSFKKGDRELEVNADDTIPENGSTPYKSVLYTISCDKRIDLENFKLVLYVSQRTEEESIGRELCLGLQHIV